MAYCIFKIDSTIIRTDAGYYRLILTLKHAIIDFSYRLLITINRNPLQKSLLTVMYVQTYQ